ncbi:hypothetical protein ABTE27_21875, partial [Acinetobacter baumannii]
GTQILDKPRRVGDLFRRNIQMPANYFSDLMAKAIHGWRPRSGTIEHCRAFQKRVKRRSGSL